LSIKAGDMPWKTTARDFPLQAYAEAISKLHARGYSYADIAAWLNGQLAAQLGHRRIGRGQVYRIYRQWLRDMEDGGRGIPTGHPAPLSDEVAEAQAEIADRNLAESEREERPHEFY
jgi:hypothetical protein